MMLIKISSAFCKPCLYLLSSFNFKQITYIANIREMIGINLLYD